MPLPFIYAVYVNDMEFNMNNTGTWVRMNDMKILLLLCANEAVSYSATQAVLQSTINELQKHCER